MTAIPDRDTLPADAACYRSTAIFDEVSLPKGLRRRHATKGGVWGVIRVLEGSLTFQRFRFPHNALCAGQGYGLGNILNQNGGNKT